jgi:hypothetical protein
MPPRDVEGLSRHIDELDQMVQSGEHVPGLAAFQGTVTLARRLYGETSPQLIALREAQQKAAGRMGNVDYIFAVYVGPLVRGTLGALKRDLRAGLVGSIARQAAGEVLGDMLGLAKEALSHSGDGPKNVAAVLTAAAFEDTIRGMGASLAGVVGRPDLSDVLTALKQSGIFVGAAFTTAQSYLKFRNDALHADWTALSPAVVGSCLVFVEHLIVTHFS